ncbi:hypothetical protein [Nonomuraea sp. NPDC046570]|uniref:hypothetical protein n=1 Tax=Nonomuraea sp. NPDC046570 TaxID=3155255 RepID=UPI00340A7CEE
MAEHAIAMVEDHGFQHSGQPEVVIAHTSKLAGFGRRSGYELTLLLKLRPPAGDTMETPSATSASSNPPASQKEPRSWSPSAASDRAPMCPCWSSATAWSGTPDTTAASNTPTCPPLFPRLERGGNKIHPYAGQGRLGQTCRPGWHQRGAPARRAPHLRLQHGVPVTPDCIDQKQQRLFTSSSNASGSTGSGLSMRFSNSAETLGAVS